MAVRVELLELANDVREGLTKLPKKLPSTLFYDDAGSALFEKITALPEYYLTRTERGLLEEHASEMLQLAGKELTLVELGAGSGSKTLLLLRALLDLQGHATYVPIDVSPAALRAASEAVRAAVPAVEVHPIEGRYHTAMRYLSEFPGPKLAVWLGSSVGNFEPSDAVRLLRDLRRALSPEDALLIGTDLRKAPAQLLPAYDDAQGVTARFNKNVLARINRELGGHFDLDRFRHVALWNDRESRVEMHLESTCPQRVRIDDLHLAILFRTGERICTEYSCKYTTPAVDRLLKYSGFKRESTWTDPRGWFAEHLARVPPHPKAA